MSDAVDDPVEAAVDAMEESGAFENGVFRVDRATIRFCFLRGLSAYMDAMDSPTPSTDGATQE